MAEPSAATPSHVAFAIDEGYLPWCAVAALSCIDRCELPPTIHILHDGALTGCPGTSALVDLLEGASAAVRLHTISDDRLSALPGLDRFGAVVWLRFLLPEVLPDVERVLYLDADTLSTDSVEPLFEIDLGGTPLGAVTNVVEPSQHGHVRALGIDDPGSFLNSGVLLMDLERMRQEGSVGALLTAVEANRQRLVWPDQDALNIVFRDRWHRLHPRWNAQNSFWEWRPLALNVIPADELDAATTSPGIVHFEGPSLCKPWHSLSRHPWKDEFWRTLGRTPWASTRPEDLTMATRLIRLLPASRQLAAYRRLSSWRVRTGR